MGKELSNGKMDKEAIKHAIKTKYLNSYKVIVAGGRDFDNYEFLKEKLDETFESLEDLDAHPIEIISGMAGILRNMNMLVTATHLVAFWDGKSHGTKHMIEIAKEKGIPVWIYKY